MPVQCTCETCGAAFFRKRSLIRARTFCSLPCRDRQPPAPAIVSDDGLTARVPLQDRAGTITGYTLVDAADVAWVQQWRWQMSPVGRAVRGEKGRTYYLHRELLGMAGDDRTEVDHINRDTLDNRRANLRKATRGQNAQNLPPRTGTTSQYRGVAWSKASGKWQAYAQVNRARVHLGFFASEADAAEAARAARSHLMPFSPD